MGIYDLYYVSERFDREIAQRVLSRDRGRVSRGKTCNHHTRTDRIEGLDIVNYCCVCGIVMSRNKKIPSN